MGIPLLVLLARDRVENQMHTRQRCRQQQPYLGNDEPTGHPQAGFGPKVAGDHDAEAGFGEPELGRAGVHELVHHHHGSAAVGLRGLN